MADSQSGACIANRNNNSGDKNMWRAVNTGASKLLHLARRFTLHPRVFPFKAGSQRVAGTFCFIWPSIRREAGAWHESVADRPAQLTSGVNTGGLGEADAYSNTTVESDTCLQVYRPGGGWACRVATRSCSLDLDYMILIVSICLG
ncbi:hypothetical protein RRG08_023706 [Elysia crispata]|uniref:Uncharacterized protein n=1 Tax=Elysia crispata TaxID=231223 RepID=A0AAE1DA18_9GAST|nr:hypothetical protein RRG08_023706 [Elysia crispata]